MFLRTASQAAGCRALLTTVTAVFPVVGLVVQFRQEPDDFVAFEPAVTPRSNAVRPDCSLVTPAPQGVRMDVKKSGYFPDRQHVTHMFAICHLFTYILFN